MAKIRIKKNISTLMKKIIILLTLSFMYLNISAHQLQFTLSDASGYGWAPLSTTPQIITLFEKSAIYPLTQTKINTSDFKGFKLMFKEIPSGIKILVNGVNKTGNKKSKFINIKLVGTCMDYQFDEFMSIDNIGIYNLGNTTQTYTKVFVINFLLINKNGVEIPTSLLSNTDAQKNLINWARMLGFSSEIIYSGSYTREVEWSPAEFNKYNILKIEFKEPISTDLKLKIYKSKDGVVSSDLFNIPFNSRIFTFNLKNNSKLNGSSLLKMSLIAKKQWAKISIYNMYLTD